MKKKSIITLLALTLSLLFCITPLSSSLSAMPPVTDPGNAGLGKILF